MLFVYIFVYTLYLEWTSGHLGIEPLIVEENIDKKVFELPASHQMVGQLSELPEVVATDLAILGQEDQGHGRHLPVGLGVLALEVEPVLLDLGELEGLGDAAAIFAQEEVRHHGVEVDRVVVGLEVPVLGRVPKLPMVPVDDADPVGLRI